MNRYISSESKVLSKTFKNKQTIIKTLLLDSAYYSFLVFIVILSVFLLTKLSFGIPTEQGLNQLVQSNQTGLLVNYLISLTIAALILIISTILIYPFFKGKIWNLISKKKFTKSYYKKYLILSLIQIPLVASLIAIILTDNMIIIGITFAAFLHLSSIFHFYLSKTKSISKTIKKSLKNFVKDILKLLPNHILLYLIFVIIREIGQLLKIHSNPFAVFLYGIALLVLAAFGRIMFAEKLNSKS